MNQLPARRKYGVRHFLIGLAIVVAFLYFWGASLNSPTSGGMASTQTTQYVPDEIDLHIQAQQFVLQALKSPSTAKFPPLPYKAGSIGDGFYRVESYVDSQNSFGAMLRSEWTVRMALVENHWFLDRMTIDGKVVYDASSGD